MSDNDAKVMITADASGVKPGVDAAKSDMSQLGPLLEQLNAQFAELASEDATQVMEFLARDVRHLGVH